MILKYKSRTGLNISKIQKKMKEISPQMEIINKVFEEYKTGDYWYDQDLLTIVRKMVKGYGKSLNESKVRQAFMIAEDTLGTESTLED